MHLHSTMATAVACLPDVDAEQPDPAADALLRHARRPDDCRCVPYYRPGDPAMEPAIHGAARGARRVLLANHGPVVSGKTLTDAVYAAEELEEAAKLALGAARRRAAPSDRTASRRPAGHVQGLDSKHRPQRKGLHLA